MVRPARPDFQPTRANMNAPERIAFLPDMQAQADSRDLPIDAVGVGRVRYPMTIRDADRLLPTVATLSMTVGLPAAAKGTHMSRFIEGGSPRRAATARKSESGCS